MVVLERLPTPRYLHWSVQEITLYRADHPLQVPRSRHLALIVEAQIGGSDMSKDFMDIGSSINIIYAKTLRAMNCSLTKYGANGTSFHGIVPGKAEIPLGKINLDVIFKTRENFRRDKLEFD